jgi:hypothetical protein
MGLKSKTGVRDGGTRRASRGPFGSHFRESPAGRADLRDPARMTAIPVPSRAEATHGVEQRVAATLHAYPGLRLVPIPAQFLRLPPAAAGAAPRVLRGGSLPDLGGAAGEVYEVVRDLWRDAGCRVEEDTGPDGRLLIVHDPAGYLLTLVQHGGDDPVLTVASPPPATRFAGRALPAGLLGGVGLGCLGPCGSAVLPVAAMPELAGAAAPYWGWVPLYLLVGVGSLCWPETRRFGAGLLAGGAIVGGAVAGFFSG